MKTKIILVVVLVCGMQLNFGCYNECSNKAGAKEYFALRDLYESGNAEPRQRFLEYSTENQIDIFLFSRECTGDPRIEPLMVLSGKQIIPQIVDRIGSEEKPFAKGVLVSVLIGINTNCQCIERDSEVIKTLDEVAVAMDQDRRIPSNDMYKQIYKQSVDSLRTQLDKGK